MQKQGDEVMCLARCAGDSSLVTGHYLFLFFIFFKRFAFFLSCFLPNFFMRLLFSIWL